MNKTLAGYMLKYDALSSRERIMVASAAAAIVLFVSDALLLGTASRENSGLRAALSEQRAEADRVAAQLDAIRAQGGHDPDAQAKARISEIEKRVAAIDASLQSVNKQLVPPERMATLLEDLLKRNRRLQLVKLVTLPPSSLIQGEQGGPAPAAESVAGRKGADSTAAVEQNVFKHGVELTLRGSYFDMLDYLAQLEALPWQMYWGRLRLDASDFNRPVLVLTLHTLSLEKTWLTI